MHFADIEESFFSADNWYQFYTSDICFQNINFW